MEIQIGSLLQGAQEATGTAIIIDVFRAFTTAAVAFSRGADRIVLVAEVSEALELRERGMGDLCVGEVAGIRPEGFDHGNSPNEMSGADVQGKTLIQSTRAGTVGMAAASNADEIYAGSFAIASATVAAVKRRDPGVVSIVAMGAEGKVRADEDEQCALFLRNLFQGREPDHDAVRSLVLAGQEAQKYSDPSKPHFHPEDRRLALEIDSHPFAIRVTREDGLLVARTVTL
ncbi:MAG: 2-phosphosulfolactate phosphatase [SAR202 cluster bacterium]|jgi:2-phosphosulfolactate phosphatase|nr:2-phosphosulfolactate phosphatase [SAR202 cluster bacterium]HAL47599.1 2-phosphosulfolactate phosphatase [Dehalococcoidia bacterium]MDP6662978.1 2-phosphosulfolactate phosphatase [SAR202 cluster bacterium]MDP6798879.1 2-phosphosulfolactate phosphatase [SAR202 cluster bacterium]MQG59067.1 2-phosphosulfolactate phosphatase [SAR202 cluster bacterium]|tara:strand:- start:5509 stop:6198 length:690 start_codon:yes stop_codon:yes gene_type:complete